MMEDNSIGKAVTKFLKNSKIMEIYPMIKNIEVINLDDVCIFIVRIYVDDPEMTKDNMYKKGLDPFYLIDHHLSKYLPYFGVPRTCKFGIVIVGPDGDVIASYID